MSGVGSEAIPAVAALLAGVAVKLMDAALDAPDDGIAPGGAAAAYALAALAIAELLDARTAGSLFLAAYAIGMAFDGRRTLPSGLSARQEAALALLGGALLAGPARMGAAFAAMVAIQALDDLADESDDRRCGRPNLALRWGRGETRLVALIALLTACRLDPVLAGLAVAAAGVVAGAWALWAGGGAAPARAGVPG